MTRHARVGILGWEPGDDAGRAARTLASLADLAPGRAVVALAGDARTLGAVAAALRPAPIELAVHGGPPEVAAELGWGWIAPAVPADELAKVAGDAGVGGPVGVHLPVVVHEDAEVARRALATPLLAPLVDAVSPTGWWWAVRPARRRSTSTWARRRPDRPGRPARVRHARQDEAGRNTVRAGIRKTRGCVTARSGPRRERRRGSLRPARRRRDGAGPVRPAPQVHEDGTRSAR